MSENNLLIEKIKDKILSLDEKLLNETEAIGLFGSLARGKFTKKSDIDLVIVVNQKKENDDIKWHLLLNRKLRELKRDVTVLVYPRKAIEKISSWYVLRLAKETILIYDRGKIANLLEKVLLAAKKHAIKERASGDGTTVFYKPDLKLGQIIKLET